MNEQDWDAFLTLLNKQVGHIRIEINGYMNIDESSINYITSFIVHTEFANDIHAYTTVNDLLRNAVGGNWHVVQIDKVIVAVRGVIHHESN